MEPTALAPPLSATGTAVPQPATSVNYPDSVDSSPRSRSADWDDPLLPAVPVCGGGVGAKLRLMCSYGGHIVPRPHDKSLCYVGGDTRIVVADRHSTLSDLTNRLSRTLLKGGSFTLKYQLPNEDLDSLISITTDEDLENMIEEYDRLAAAGSANNSTSKSSRLRLFLFPSKSDSASSIGSLLENSTKSEDWFLNALNGATTGFSESSSVNCLLGLDDEVAIAGNATSTAKDVEAQLESFGNVKRVSSNINKLGAQDVHSLPDSPMLETSSSFGSTSSSPSLANLPPIRVHVEDHKAAVGGIEEKFSQMSVAAAVQRQDDGAFLVLSSPPTMLATAPAAAAQGIQMGSAGIPGDYSNRVFSDDERSEQGMPVGNRKPPQTQPPPQSQAKQTGAVDLASPDSLSSDGSITNPLSRQRAMIYQETVVQNSSGNNRVTVYPVDPNSRVQMQQFTDCGYVLPTQFDQHQQLNPQQQQQQQQQKQQQQQQQQLLQQQHQQFIQAGGHYINHHPTGAAPIGSYYPIYPPQQQPLHPQNPHDQQFPVYYVAARQAQAYNLQSNYSENAPSIPSSRPQTPPPSTVIPSSAAYNTAINAPAPKSEIAAGIYRTATATATASPLGQVPSSQHQPQYVGFSQIHNPPQSIAPTSASNANYTYEFADPAHAQIYYTQPLAPQLAAQYQTMTSAAAMVLPEASAQLPTDNITQQIRTSQP